MQDGDEASKTIGDATWRISVHQPPLLFYLAFYQPDASTHPLLTTHHIRDPLSSGQLGRSRCRVNPVRVGVVPRVDLEKPAGNLRTPKWSVRLCVYQMLPAKRVSITKYQHRITVEKTSNQDATFLRGYSDSHKSPCHVPSAPLLEKRGSRSKLIWEECRVGVRFDRHGFRRSTEICTQNYSCPTSIQPQLLCCVVASKVEDP